MKRAEEWIELATATSFMGTELFVRAIQQDALLSAAAVIKKCDCTQSEAHTCQFGPLGICNEPAYWRILELLPEPV